MANSSVAGMRSKISLSAGVPCANDTPRLPCSAPFRKYRYCSHSGLSSPSAAIVRAMSCWSACGLMRMSTGLPMAYTPRNTRIDITNSTATDSSNLRIRNTSI